MVAADAAEFKGVFQMEARRGGSMVGILWLIAVIVLAVLLAQFVNAALGGIVGLVLAVLVFLLVIRQA